MTKILIRHAESFKNVGGDYDGGLTYSGFNQADALWEQIAPYQDFWIYVSPYLRTIQTAARLELPFTVDARLAEYIPGVSELFELKSGVLIYPETDDFFLGRLKKFAHSIHNEDAIIISHGTPIQVLRMMFEFQRIEKVPEWDESVDYSKPIVLENYNVC